MNELIQKLKSTTTGRDVCRVLLDTCFADKELSEPQLDVLVDMFGEPDLASHALLHLHSLTMIEDMWEMNEVYSIIYEKFVSDSAEMVTLLNPSILA
jgi:hypothetical protein